ncbi:MAG: hypothetical protein H7289_00715 [Mucilaginibacter sp.]|nr:hypothetical protein [Mucilaginibacter sp.]
MRLGKYFWLIGPLIILMASLLLYYQYYRDNTWLFFLCLIFSFLGWVIIYWFPIKNSLPYKKTLAKIRSVTWLGQIDLFIIACLCALTVSVVIDLAKSRETDLLKNAQTINTVAEITGIEQSHYRSGTNYYAIFQYTTGTKTIKRRLNNADHQYLWGQRYEIKYVIEYPEMFKVIKLLP